MKERKNLVWRYPEFGFVDTAFGGAQNRNNIRDVSELQLPPNPVDCFASLFRFKEDFKKHVESTGSVRGADGFECYSDYLYFDIDSEDLDKALDRTWKLIRHIELNYDLSLDHIRVWFSGNKGFHVGIPSVVFGIVPSADLPRIVKKMAVELGDGMGIDTSIYEKNRLFRLENSIHPKTGFYKIPILTNQALFRLVDEIRSLAKTPRREEVTPFSEMSVNPKLRQVYERAKRDVQTRKASGLVRGAVTKKCIARLLGGVKEHERNEAACRVVDHLKKQGVTKEIVKTVVMAWNQSNSPPTDERELEATVESVFDGDYDYGCNDAVLKRYCDPDCRFHPRQKARSGVQKQKGELVKTPVSFCQLPDGSLVEMLYDADRKPRTFLARFKEGNISYLNQIETEDRLIVPFSGNQIVQTKTILFPSRAEPYGDDKELLEEIRAFVHQYLGISEFYEKLVCYYVPFTWIYDCFNVLPYLRALGDWGSGKSRFLQVIGSICYKPIFCSGAATTSPIFRLIEKFKGTIVVDEGDFRDSDEAARLIKIFNQGYMQGFPVIINEPIGNRYEPRSYDVFSPKILATRNEFKDKALESRCMTEVMDDNLRDDIPLILPNSFWEEALYIRNKLLTWRFKHWGPKEVDLSLTDRSIEPRLAQVTLPLFNIITDPNLRLEFKDFIRSFNRKTILDRGETLEGEVLNVICSMFDESEQEEDMTMGRIALKLNEDRGSGEKELKARKVGWVVTKKLRLDKVRPKRGFCIAKTSENEERLARLKVKYGIEDQEDPPRRRTTFAMCAMFTGRR